MKAFTSARRGALLVTLATLPATLVVAETPARAQCCFNWSLYRHGRVHRPYPYHARPLLWSAGLHLTGVSATQRIDGDGVALAGMGAHLRYRTYRFGGEFSMDVMGNDFLDGGVSRVAVPLQVSALLYLLPEGPLNLYLLGGFQVAFTNVEWNLPNLYDEQVFTQFGAQAGVGAELSLGHFFVLTADVRFFGLIRADGGPAGSYYEDIEEETIVPKKTAGAQLNLGAGFRF